MIFADKLITLRKKAGWSQEELAEKLGVTRQSVSKWEGAQSVPDIDKILQLARLFGVTTDYLLKEEQGEPEYTAEDDTPALHRVTLTQAGDYLKKARANAPRMALASALCVLSPVSLLALSALSEYNLLGISENFAAGLGLCILLALVAVAVVLFMQCGAAVKPYEFLEKEPIDTEYGVTGLVRERRDAFAAHYNRANTIGTVLCMALGGPIIDVYTVVLGPVINGSLPLPVRLGLLVAGCVILAFGMTIVICSEAGTGPNDLVGVVLSDKLGKPFGPVRVAVDLFFALSGFALGGVLGLGTVICAFVVGPAAQGFMPVSRRICDGFVHQFAGRESLPRGDSL